MSERFNKWKPPSDEPLRPPEAIRLNSDAVFKWFQNLSPDDMQRAIRTAELDEKARDRAATIAQIEEARANEDEGP